MSIPQLDTNRKCKYFPTPDGCKKGNSCPFRHTYEIGTTNHKVRECWFGSECDRQHTCGFVHPGEIVKKTELLPGRSSSIQAWRKPAPIQESPKAVAAPSNDNEWTPETWEQHYSLEDEIRAMLELAIRQRAELHK